MLKEGFKRMIKIVSKDVFSGLDIVPSVPDKYDEVCLHSHWQTYPSFGDLRISCPSFNHIAEVVEVTEAELHPVSHGFF